MGLQGSFTAEDGTVYLKCYALYLHLRADKTSCFVTFGLCPSKEERDKGLESIFATRTFHVPVEALTLSTPSGLYPYAKQLSEFADWEDIIEAVPVVEEPPVV